MAMTEQWMEGAAGPTMQDLRDAGVAAHLAPIRQQLDGVAAAIRAEVATMSDEQREQVRAVCRAADVSPSVVGLAP
ncbi:hypothetical protein ACWFRF_20790 [Nocardia sp. NPDC055165]